MTRLLGRTFLFAATIVAAIAGQARTQGTSEPEGEAMILFSYWPKEGQEGAFHDGYRKHLDWHRANMDPILWYAWDVIVGPRAGLFVDGAFDIPFAALDQRVKPAEDFADFRATAASYASVNDRVLYRLRRDLSTGTPLENREARGMTLALTYKIHAGSAQQFESLLARLHDTPITPFTCYEVVAGAGHPEYLLLVQHASWADIGAGVGIARAISRSELVDKQRLLSDLSNSVSSTESEIWRYRADLTYMP